MSHQTSTSPELDHAPESIAAILKGWLEEERAKLPEEPVENEIWRILDHMREEIERSNEVIVELIGRKIA